MRTVSVACKLPNGLKIGDHLVRGYAEELSGPQTRTLWHGYAITPGFPKEAWDDWLARNADSEAVRARLVFAEEDGGYLMELCRQRAKVPQAMGRAVPGVSL